MSKPSKTPANETVTTRAIVRPFLRQTMTINPPWAGFGGFPITVEIVVLAGDLPDDDWESATREDMPELDQAGWKNLHSTPFTDVFVRTIT